MLSNLVPNTLFSDKTVQLLQHSTLWVGATTFLTDQTWNNLPSRWFTLYCLLICPAYHSFKHSRTEKPVRYRLCSHGVLIWAEERDSTNLEGINTATPAGPSRSDVSNHASYRWDLCKWSRTCGTSEHKSHCVHGSERHNTCVKECVWMRVSTCLCSRIGF